MASLEGKLTCFVFGISCYIIGISFIEALCGRGVTLESLEDVRVQWEGQVNKRSSERETKTWDMESNVDGANILFTTASYLHLSFNILT